MALAISLQLATPFPPPGAALRRLRCRRISSAVSTSGGSPAVVWFKRDLRLDDHPGLVAAVNRHPAVVPLYVFDPRLLAGYSDEMLKLLLFALDDLKGLLLSKDSDLIIRIGNAEDVVLNIANEVRASHIFVEREVENSALSVIGSVDSLLSTANLSGKFSPDIILWSADLYDFKSLADIPSSYDRFLKAKFPTLAPLPSPNLPAIQKDLNRGDIPTLQEVKTLIKGRWLANDAGFMLCKNLPAIDMLRKSGYSKMDSSYNTVIMNEASTSRSVSSREPKRSMFASEEDTEVCGGTDVALDALSAYLRYLEGTSNANWQELHQKARNTEFRDGASFYPLFGSALSLGVITRRRVYYEAIKYERERNAGFLSPFGYSTPTVKAAVDAVCSMEWYWILALKSQVGNEEMYPVKIWRWRGHLVQYTCVGKRGPAVLLVHGFGAFLDHFRDNIHSIADRSHRVWAITLVGFGKSEKPNINYTEFMWAELVRDFIVDVVAEPVHLAGNSIGGYVVAIVAGLWPNLVKSLVLINTAGSIVPGSFSISVKEQRRSSWTLLLQARLLLFFLQLTVGSILKDYYPTCPERVDEALIGWMMRASYDPGAVEVVESVFGFNLSIPLNILFKSFGGQVSVIQGMRDPLTKSDQFVAMLQEHCSMVSIRPMHAGHCPHDELPEEFNSFLCEWITRAEAVAVT